MAANKQFELKSEQWDMPRHGERILKLPVLNELVNLWMANPQQIIEIRYPGGEEGELWLTELSDWLISLAIPSKAIRPTLGSGAEDKIVLILLDDIH